MWPSGAWYGFPWLGILSTILTNFYIVEPQTDRSTTAHLSSKTETKFAKARTGLVIRSKLNRLDQSWFQNIYPR